MAEQLIHDWLEATQANESGSIQEEQVLSELANSLDTGTIAFPDFIKTFTSRLEQEVDLTVAGRVLSLLPKTFVTIQKEPTRHEVHVLIPYLCARLEDASPGIYYVAEALQIMVGWTRFAPGDAQEIARAVFKLGSSNNFSSQTAVTRLSLYSLVDVLRTTRAVAIKRDMSVKEFVKGVVTMAELEKNPSCLRALFTLYANLSRDWELDEGDFKHVFDSYVRYFPITMKDAPKDPKIPTTAELRDLLLSCFVASDGYAQPTFAAMIERLDVDSANTKVEVFKTLSSAVQSYSVPTVSSSAAKLWDSLKFEIWNGENDQWIQSSLDLLRDIAFSLDRSPSDWADKTSPVYTFVINALSECRDRIKDKPTTYLRTSGRIFNALASASPYTFYLTSRTVVPIMDTLAQAHSTGAERTFVLEVLNGILGARLAQNDIRTPSLSAESNKSPELVEYQTTSLNTMSTTFGLFRDRLLEIYHEGMVGTVETSEESTADTAHCVPAIKGLELMFSIPSYLSDSERGMIVHQLVQIVLAKDQKADLIEQSSVALSTISGLQPELFQDVILPGVLGTLPDQLSAEESEQESQMSAIISQLESLVRISNGTSSNAKSRQLNFAALEENLIRRLVKTLHVPGQQSYHHAILAAISTWFESATDVQSSTNQLQESLQSENQKQFAPIPFLLSHIVETNIVDGQAGLSTIDTVDDTMVRFAGEYIMRSLRSKPASSILLWDQELPTTSSVVWNLFSRGEASTLDSLLSTSAVSEESRGLASAISMYLVAGAQREDVQYLKTRFDVQALAKALISSSITDSTTSRFSRLSNLQLLQLLINKFGAARGTDLVDFISSQIESTASLNDSEASNAFQGLAYFTAASLAALDPRSNVLLQHMLDGLQNVKHGRKIAQSFRLLLAPSDIITKENSCVVRPLRKGRLYQMAVVPLSTTWRASQDPSIKQNALIALTGILAFLEPSMLADNAKELMPILLEGTNIQGDQFAKNACIKAILDLLPIAPKAIEEHIAAVIERMTDRTHNTYHSPSDSNVRGRAMALEVLSKLTEVVDKSVLLKRKAGLMKELNYALEDCSSEVRSKAERCKMSWFNLMDGE